MIQVRGALIWEMEDKGEMKRRQQWCKVRREEERKMKLEEGMGRRKGYWKKYSISCKKTITF